MGLKDADISETHHKIEIRQVFVLAGIAGLRIDNIMQYRKILSIVKCIYGWSRSVASSSIILRVLQ